MIVESFERIHRSNLVGMGVLPLEFKEGQKPRNLEAGWHGDLRHHWHRWRITPRMDMRCTDHRADGSPSRSRCSAASIREDEVDYYKNGGILQYVLRNMMKAA